VVGLGIGFGGTLVWLAAAQGAPIDDFVLWAVPTKGRRLLREAEAAALFDTDPRVELDEPSDFGHEPDELLTEGALLDQAGMILTKDTVNALSRIDLTRLTLTDPPNRQVLLLERESVSADARVRDHLESAGLAVSVASGDEYGPMMRYARFSEIPRGAIADSISWLKECAERTSPHGTATRRFLHSPVRALDTLALSHEGIAIRERPFSFELEGKTLYGIITEPVGAPARDVCAVFFNNGADRRLGPNRMWVDSARRWAAWGVTCVRFDHIAIGDSDGEEHYYEEIDAYYEPGMTDRNVAILRALEARGLPGHFVLVGLCSSAYWSFQAALADARVVGAFTINLPFFFRTRWTLRVASGWIVRRKIRPEDSRIKAVAISRMKKGWRAVLAARRMMARARRSPNQAELALDRLSSRGTEVLMLLTPGWPVWDELDGIRRLDAGGEMPGLNVRRIPGYDSRLRPLPLQRFVTNELDDALTRVLEARQPESPARLAVVEAR
jgi:hypothetical protein